MRFDQWLIPPTKRNKKENLQQSKNRSAELKLSVSIVTGSSLVEE
jgi:hypothetical protein